MISQKKKKNSYIQLISSENEKNNQALTSLDLGRGEREAYFNARDQ
jgi:hypothetical protein